MKHLLQLFNELSLHPKNAKALKGLILQLAIQGKLTENWRAENPDVESAKDLLEKAKEEKKILVKQKLIKKEKTLPNISNADKSNYEIPDNWAIARLGNVGNWGAGATPLRSNHKFYNGDVNWFKSGELNNSIIDYESNEKITELAVEKTSVRLNKPGDVLIAMYGATIGKTGLLAISGTTNQAVCACMPFKCINSEYLHLLLKGFKQVFLNQGEGGAQPNISRVKIRNQIFILPPLKEQKAIVSIVQELFADVEQLEQKTVARIQLKKDYVNSALQDLAQADDVVKAWQDIQPHFKTFFNEKANIKQLRETILELAVKGKLTANWRKQRRLSGVEAEPASELLKRIVIEKQKLVDEKKIKKEKPLPKISEDDKPFALPDGWEWCKMGEIFTIGSSKRVFKSDYVKEGVPFFRSKEIGQLGRGEEVSAELFISREKFNNLRNNFGICQSGDVLIACIGGSIGNTWLVDDREFYYKDGNLVQIRSIIDINSLFLLNYLKSNIFYESALGKVSGSAYNALTIEKIRNSDFPLPPLEEQKAIVKIVDALMAECDALERNIEQRDTLIEDLMASCLYEMENKTSSNQAEELGMVEESGEKYLK